MLWKIQGHSFALMMTLPVHLSQKMQLHLVMPILVLALGQSSWMKLAVVAMKPVSLTALRVLLSTVLVATYRMLEYDVKV